MPKNTCTSDTLLMAVAKSPLPLLDLSAGCTVLVTHAYRSVCSHSIMPVKRSSRDPNMEPLFLHPPLRWRIGTRWGETPSPPPHCPKLVAHNLPLLPAKLVSPFLVFLFHQSAVESDCIHRRVHPHVDGPPLTTILHTETLCRCALSP